MSDAYGHIDLSEERELFSNALNNPEVVMQEGETYTSNDGTFRVIADGSIVFESKDGKTQRVYAPGSTEHKAVLALFGATDVQTKKSMVGAAVGSTVGTLLASLGMRSQPMAPAPPIFTPDSSEDDDKKEEEGWGAMEWTLAVVGSLALVGGIGYFVYQTSKSK